MQHGVQKHAGGQHLGNVDAAHPVQPFRVDAVVDIDRYVVGVHAYLIPESQLSQSC